MINTVKNTNRKPLGSFLMDTSNIYSIFISVDERLTFLCYLKLSKL